MNSRFFVLLVLLGSFALSPTLQAEQLAESIELMRAGKYEEAQERLESVPVLDPLALRLQIELLDRRGMVEEARRKAVRCLGIYDPQNVLSMAQAAYAAWYLQRWEEANSIYIEASELDSASPSMFVDWGRLYLEKYNPAEAESIFQEGLQKTATRPELERWDQSDLFLGLAQALRDQSKPGGEQAIERAMEINPDNLAITAYKVSFAIKEEDWGQVATLVEEGRRKNEGYLPLLELDCARAYFTGDEEAYRSLQEEIFEISSRNDRFFEVLADLSVMKRRLGEAIDFYDRALELKPNNWSALASKGINLLRLGREGEGVAALERAYEHDPYNIWTVNTLRLVDSFQRFERYETPDFSVKLHQDEAAALKPYVMELLERSLSELQSRYNHEIDHKVTFEMYRDHEDFAVRALGMPGLGALGATFGRVVAMDSPTARDRDEFHWASTLWHEMAHVVTLSLSDNKVPRWFTEGLSMMEERLGGRGWGDGLNLRFVEAYREDQLLSLSELNSGFVRPKFPEQISLSYLQAGWICEVLARDFGLQKLRDMLIAYSEGKTTEEVFEEVLGESVEEVDQIFQTEMDRVLSPLVERLKRPVEPLETIEEIASALKAQPESFHLNLALGQAMAREERNAEAVPFLEKALEIFPQYAGKGSAYALLTEIYSKQGRTDQLLDILSEWWRRHPLIADNAIKLSRLLADRGDRREAIQVLREAVYTDPFSLELHQNLGELYFTEEQPEKAAEEFAVLLSLDPVDRAGAHYNLARALKGAGNTEEARRQILLSLEIAPGFEKAQQLLLSLIRQ